MSKVLENDGRENRKVNSLDLLTTILYHVEEPPNSLESLQEAVHAVRENNDFTLLECFTPVVENEEIKKDPLEETIKLLWLSKLGTPVQLSYRGRMCVKKITRSKFNSAELKQIEKIGEEISSFCNQVK